MAIQIKVDALVHIEAGDKESLQERVQTAIAQALAPFHEGAAAELRLLSVHAEEIGKATLDPPGLDPFAADKATVPQVVCPDCGHKSHREWEILEETVVSRSIGVGSQEDLFPVPGDGFEGYLYGEITDTGDGDPGNLMCPNCYKECEIPDRFFDWFL